MVLQSTRRPLHLSPDHLHSAPHVRPPSTDAEPPCLDQAYPCMPPTTDHTRTHRYTWRQTQTNRETNTETLRDRQTDVQTTRSHDVVKSLVQLPWQIVHELKLEANARQKNRDTRARRICS